jgi:hypothetical protein
MGMAESWHKPVEGRAHRCRPWHQLDYRRCPKSPRQSPSKRAGAAENQDLQQALDIRVRVCYTSQSRGQVWPWAAVTQKEATTMSIESTVRIEECQVMQATLLCLSPCTGGAVKGRPI